MSQLNLFGFPDAPLQQPVLAKAQNKHHTMRQREEAADKAGLELIRYDARSYCNLWIIKKLSREGAGGWLYWHRFTTEPEAKAKWDELMKTGNYIAG